jgi:RNA polymerase sigma-70 factor (ECF subfamily)
MPVTDDSGSASADRDPATWPVLMAQAQDGDRDSYRRLLLAITPYVRAMASRAMQDRAEIEDAVQDILLTLHEARRTYDPSRPFKPWLAAIARYRIIDRQRSRFRLSARETTLGPEHETFTADPPNGDGMAMDGHAVRVALTGLPFGQRQAIELLKMQEMSLKEASGVSGMSVAALKVATHRALKQLRRLLGEDHEIRERPRNGGT